MSILDINLDRHLFTINNKIFQITFLSKYLYGAALVLLKVALKIRKKIKILLKYAHSLYGILVVVFFDKWLIFLWVTVFFQRLLWEFRSGTLKEPLNFKIFGTLKKLIIFSAKLCTEMYIAANRSMRNILINVALCTHVYTDVGTCLCSMVW